MTRVLGPGLIGTAALAEKLRARAERLESIPYGASSTPAEDAMREVYNAIAGDVETTPDLARACAMFAELAEKLRSRADDMSEYGNCNEEKSASMALRGIAEDIESVLRIKPKGAS